MKKAKLLDVGTRVGTGWGNIPGRSYRNDLDKIKEKIGDPFNTIKILRLKKYELDIMRKKFVEFNSFTKLPLKGKSLN